MSDTKNNDHNEGVAQVRALMNSDRDRCGTQEKLGSLTGLDQSSWSLYLAGRAKPGRLAREVIRRKLKIPVDSWDKPVHAPMNVHSDAQVSSQAPESAPTAPEVA